MKRMNYWASILVVVAAFFICFGNANAQAEIEYLGEFCLQTQIPGSIAAPPGIFLRVGVVSYGNGHFVLHGTRGSDDTPAYGTAMISGDKIIASISTSVADSNLSYFSMMHLVIDGTTFSGTATELVESQQPTSPIETVVFHFGFSGGPCQFQ